MTQIEFKALSYELRSCCAKIPLHWGKVQNNSDDSLLDIFSINSFQELEKEIANIESPEKKDYIKRRWFLTQCSRCDEYLFCATGNATQNPDHKAKEYDVKFFGNDEWKFDIKGTVIPQAFRKKDYKDLIKEPQDLADWFYENQSKEVRFDIQNRIFVIHLSLVDSNREPYLRTAWKTKAATYLKYTNLLSQGKRFILTHNVKADFIWLVEEKPGSITSYFS